MARNLALDSARENKAGGLLDDAAASAKSTMDFNRENLQGYMNPYTSEVVDRSLGKERQAYEAEKASLQGGSALRGAFGGSRQALLETGLKQKHLETVGDITTSGYKDAFDKASQLWQADNTRKLQVSDALRQVGGDVSRLNSQQISDLVATGQTDRLLKQAEMDFDYGQFIENRDWDVTNLQPLISTLASVPHSSTQTTKQSGGALGTILGAAATVAGAYFSGGASLAGGAGGVSSFFGG